MKFIIISILVSITFSGAFSSDLNTADSLFSEKKYTESFEIYKKLHEEDRLISPSIFLKMAYIKEGLGGYSDALYYLNLYYLKTADKKALGKMESLADKKDLRGYTNTDFEFIQTVFFKYYNQIVLIILSLAVLSLVLSYYLKFKRGGSPSFALILMVILLCVAFYVINFGKAYDKAIITQSNTYLMSGPSSASEMVKIIKKGNRVNTQGQSDIWTKVEIGNTTGYVKTSKLKEVRL